MSPRLAFAATVAVSVLVAAGPSSAWPFGGRDRQQAEERPRADAAAPAATAPRKASPAVRAQADRLEPLARAAFWSGELELDPTDPEAGVKFAQALRSLGRNDEAAAAVERVLVAQPENVEALLELGRAHIGRGQAFYAVDPLKRARTAAPRDWRAPSLLGVAYDQINRPDEAMAAWNEALALSPENPAVMTNMALALAAKGQSVEAETLLRRAVARPGATIQMRQNLALLLGLRGATAEAERLLREDLPPEQAEANLAWFRSRTAASAPASRTWEGVSSGQTN